MLAIGLISLLAAAGHARGDIEIVTLSGSADRVSGGDALVRISNAQPKPREGFSVRLNGRNITSVFHSMDPDDVSIGLVTGLRVGRNRLIVTAAGRRRSLIVTNYPIQGPIVSGPHVQPFVCQMNEWTLPDGSSVGPPLDSDCSIAPRITYLYYSSRDNRFVALENAKHLPADVDQATTTTGAVVNFIVRVETATVNRGIYQSAVLHDPTSAPGPTALQPPKAWNKVLIGVQGSGCAGGWYRQGGVLDSFLDPIVLAKGYALFTNTLQNPSISCNAFLAGETAMMSKEYFIEHYGVPDLSLALGQSGGAYTSLQTADAFPGVFDGVITTQTFPDALSIAIASMDAHLLRHYFTFVNPNGFREAEQVAVSGYSGKRAWFDAANQAGRTDAVPGRRQLDDYTSAVWNPVVPQALRYDPQSNPSGARPTIWDVSRNIYGIDRASGFALRAYDNVGVQYGLGALNSGALSVNQFLDLNESIGGFDRDDNFVQSRTHGDTHAILEAYRSGLNLSGGGGLAAVPIIDLSGPIDENANYHYQWSHFAVKERLERANKASSNFIMWRGNSTASAPVEDRAIELMTHWVAAIRADGAKVSSPADVLARKPAALTSGCWISAESFTAEEQTFHSSSSGPCSDIPRSYAFPRYVAGGPLAADILKCRLKPADRRDYSARWSEAQWNRLQRIFSSGVCDWGQTGQYFRPIEVGHSYGPAPSRKYLRR